MTTAALLLADAGSEDGLGHLSRLSAIAVALRSRGIATYCHANDATASLERDGVEWAPWAPGDHLPSDVDVVILDSYRLDPASVVDANLPFVVFRDEGDERHAPSLIVSVAAPSSDIPPRLSGPRYAALRPSYWGMPPRDISGPLRRILVTTGGGDPGGIGAAIARAVADLVPDAGVTLVRGPHAQPLAIDGVQSTEAPDSLFEEQRVADIVICGGGQTMLEAVACGTPCIALVLVENQRDQALRLASSRAVVVVDPADVDEAVSSVRNLDPAARLELSRRAQRTVDGYGALRIAYHVEALLRRTP